MVIFVCVAVSVVFVLPDSRLARWQHWSVSYRMGLAWRELRNLRAFFRQLPKQQASRHPILRVALTGPDNLRQAEEQAYSCGAQDLKVSQGSMPSFVPLNLAGLAKLSGVTKDVISSYTTIGLVPQPRRRLGPSGKVTYHREHLDRIRFINRALALGFSLDAIGELLGVDGGHRTCGDVYRVAQRTLAAVRSLDIHPSSTLENLAAACPRRGGAIDCPILANLSQPEGCENDLSNWLIKL